MVHSLETFTQSWVPSGKRQDTRHRLHQYKARQRRCSSRAGNCSRLPNPAGGFLMWQAASWSAHSCNWVPRSSAYVYFFSHPSKHPVSYLYSLTNVFLFKETEESSLRRFHYLQPRILTPAGRKVQQVVQRLEWGGLLTEETGVWAMRPRESYQRRWW